MLDPVTWIVLALAAFAGGTLNAIAGGGTFLTFPALVWAGVPPIPANATSAFSVCPGYIGSIAGFRQELAALPRRLLLREMTISAIGGAVGAGLLLITPSDVFSGIVPWLLLVATALFAMGPWLVRRLGDGASPLARWRNAGLLVGTGYGGYFNGGVGILLLAWYLLVGEKNLNTGNALKNLNSTLLSVVSVAAYAVGGAIVWTPALVMAVFAAAGGFAGARLAKWLPVAWVRAIVISTGAVMTVIFFVRA